MSKTTSTWYESEPDTLRSLHRFFRLHLDHDDAQASVFVHSDHESGPITAVLTQITPFEARELAEIFTLIYKSYN